MELEIVAYLADQSKSGMAMSISQMFIEKKRTLNYPRQFVVLIEVDQLLLRIHGGSSKRGVTLATESHIRKIEPKEGHRWRSSVPQHRPIFVVVSTMVGQPSQRLQLYPTFLR